jgi:FemAB-related protein (PEP-CTERM system-associated)
MAETSTVIKELTGGEAKRWDVYVRDHRQASFFHLSGWRGVLENGLGHATYYLYAEAQERITGVLPLVHIKSMLFGNTLSSLGFCTYGGALADSEAVRDALEQAAVDQAHDLGVGCLELRYREPSGKDRPIKDLYETFAKPIDPDPDRNMQAIRGKQRNIIRKGIKNGLKGQVDSVDNFYPVYAESVRNLGTPVFPRRLFVSIHEAFPDETEFFSACYGDRVISSAMNFYFRNEVCPYYWGGTEEARRLKGNDFLCWEIMCRAAARRCSKFDFGRSKKGTGAYQWKENLGFIPSQLFYEYELVRDKNVPNINPMNPKYRLFIEGWKRLPLPIARWIGPWLSRSLG